MTEYTPIEHESVSTVAASELQKAVTETISKIEHRSFSARHPELGKMVNCQVCRRRHRLNERKCEQVFTYSIGDFEFFREGEDGKLVPFYRTAVTEGSQPTAKQVMGRAAFNKKRFHPHPSKIKLLFVERVRKVFIDLGFDIEEKDKEIFSKNLQRARVVAARQLRRERHISTRATRLMQDASRKINRA